MDARQLQYFLAIVDHDGFGRAAQHLHVSQPSLSQAMAALEREFGVLLFHRINRGVVISTAGSELIEPARQVLRDLQTTKATMASLKGLQRGTVELITMPAPGIEPLSTLASRFALRHPGVTLQVGAAFTPAEVVDNVRQGACELGLAGLTGPLSEQGVEVRLLERQPFVLVGAGEGFPDVDPVPREALDGARLIESPAAGGLMRRIVDDLRASGADVQVVAEVAHRTSILPMVLRGVGMAVLPSSWAPLARLAGARTALLDPPHYLDVTLLSRTAPMTPAAQAFLALAHAYRPADYLRDSTAKTDPDHVT